MRQDVNYERTNLEIDANDANARSSGGLAQMA
jgi:hypothetical protein